MIPCHPLTCCISTTSSNLPPRCRGLIRRIAANHHAFSSDPEGRNDRGYPAAQACRQPEDSHARAATKGNRHSRRMCSGRDAHRPSAKSSMPQEARREIAFDLRSCRTIASASHRACGPVRATRGEGPIVPWAHVGIDGPCLQLISLATKLFRRMRWQAKIVGVSRWERELFDPGGSSAR